MKNDREALISEMIAQIDENNRKNCRRIISCLTELGYAPHKENVRGFVLSFKNSEVKQTIAKIGIRNGKQKGVFYSIKFYACKNPPERFSCAVRNAVLKSNGQYRCSDCGACGAKEGERGYGCALQDGTEFLRCGAYAVEIPELTDEDTHEVCSLLSEQHNYFLNRRNDKGTCTV